MGGEKGCGGGVDGRKIPRNAFKALLTALESLRMIWMMNVSSEIRTRSEGVLEWFYAMVVFRQLSGRQIDPIANLAIALRQVLPRAYAYVHARVVCQTRQTQTYVLIIFKYLQTRRARTRVHARTRTYTRTRAW